MAETFLENVKLKIGTETQFQEKLKDLPIGTLVGTTDPISEGDLSTDIINKLVKADNALPKPTNDTTGSTGQVLKKTASGSEWGDVQSGSTVSASTTTSSGNADLREITIDSNSYNVAAPRYKHMFVSSDATQKVIIIIDDPSADTLSSPFATMYYQKAMERFESYYGYDPSNVYVPVSGVYINDGNVEGAIIGINENNAYLFDVSVDISGENWEDTILLD